MYELDKPDNVVEILEESVAKHPKRLFLGMRDKSGDYHWITYADFGKRVDNLRSALAQLGEGHVEAGNLLDSDPRRQHALGDGASRNLGHQEVEVDLHCFQQIRQPARTPAARDPDRRRGLIEVSERLDPAVILANSLGTQQAGVSGVAGTC